MINGGLNKIFQYIPVPEDLPEALLRDNAAFAEIYCQLQFFHCFRYFPFECIHVSQTIHRLGAGMGPGPSLTQGAALGY